MADDTSKRGARDRATVAEGEIYELDYFAEKHGLSRDEAQALIDRVGNSREKLDAAVAKKSSGPSRRGKAASRSTPAAGRATKKRSTSSRSRAKPTAAAAITAPVVETVAAAKRGAKNATSAARRKAAAAPKAAKRRTAATVDAAKSAATNRTASLLGAAAAGLVTGLAVNIGRKAIVQAPSALAGDWFEALKVEHKLALAIFDKLQKTDDNQTGKRATLLMQLKHALGKHAFTEENVIYPALREWGDKADADKLNHDHGYVKQYLYELDGMGNGSPAFLAKVADFRAEIEAHIREEEQAIFPPLHAALGEAGNARVTALANKEGFKVA